MNTQLPRDKFVSSYGLDLENQNKLLNQMNDFIKSMRVHQKRYKTKIINNINTTMKPFQKGIQ